MVIRVSASITVYLRLCRDATSARRAGGNVATAEWQGSSGNADRAQAGVDKRTPGRHSPMRNGEITRILAIDVRSQRLGYVVFEIPVQLLDWGIRSMCRCPREAGGIASVIDLFRPSVVALHRLSKDQRRNTSNVRRNTREIKREAHRCGVPVVMVNEGVLTGFYQTKCRRRTKHEIATKIAARFPELAWKLPQRRKIWQAQPARMAIFEAASVGLAFLASQSSSQAIGRMLRRP